MIFFWFYLSGLSNRIMRKIFSHWRLEPVYNLLRETWYVECIHKNRLNNFPKICLIICPFERLEEFTRGEGPKNEFESATVNEPSSH